MPTLKICESAHAHLLVTVQYICCCCLAALGGDVILSVPDLYSLTQILRSAAPDWKTVGMALGFPKHEHDIIECNRMLALEGVTGYFREMLSQWLKWAPPNHVSPTVENLAHALQSSGHEDLAVELQKKFLRKKGGVA